MRSHGDEIACSTHYAERTVEATTSKLSAMHERGNCRIPKQPQDNGALVRSTEDALPVLQRPRHTGLRFC